MGRAMLSKSLIQFSIDGWGSVPYLLFDLKPNYGGGNEDNGDLLQRSHGDTASLSAPDPAAGHCRPMPLLETPGHSQASLGQSLVGSLLLSPGSWCTQDFVCALQHHCLLYNALLVKAMVFPGVMWRRKWQPTPVLLPGKFHGLRSLVGYSPWDRKELDMTEQLHIHMYGCESWTMRKTEHQRISAFEL